MLRIRSGEFDFDARLDELRKGARRLRVPHQSMDILEALLARAGDLVTREELCARLWPSKSFGDFEHGLNAAVRRLREALGDSAESPSSSRATSRTSDLGIRCARSPVRAPNWAGETP
jgi:DNA-binding winged helix-turn-helix (wHTH) protein